jgi:hypothetical protein
MSDPRLQLSSQVSHKMLIENFSKTFLEFDQNFIQGAYPSTVLIEGRRRRRRRELGKKEEEEELEELKDIKALFAQFGPIKRMATLPNSPMVSITYAKRNGNSSRRAVVKGSLLEQVVDVNFDPDGKIPPLL